MGNNFYLLRHPVGKSALLLMNSKIHASIYVALSKSGGTPMVIFLFLCENGLFSGENLTDLLIYIFFFCQKISLKIAKWEEK